jgi:hypothetical protein
VKPLTSRLFRSSDQLIGGSNGIQRVLDVRERQQTIDQG